MTIAPIALDEQTIDALVQDWYLLEDEQKRLSYYRHCLQREVQQIRERLSYLKSAPLFEHETHQDRWFTQKREGNRLAGVNTRLSDVKANLVELHQALQERPMFRLVLPAGLTRDQAVEQMTRRWDQWEANHRERASTAGVQ